MSLKHGILGLLSYHEFSGYELNRIFSDSLSFFWPAQISQIYRELTTLEKVGWVQSRTVVQKDHPNKKLFRLTDSGRQELTRWLSIPKADEPLSSKFPIMLKTFFSSDLSDEWNLTDLRRLRQRFEDELGRLRAMRIEEEFSEQDIEIRPHRSLYWRATILFGQSYHEMCLRWIDSVISMIENPGR